MTTLARTAADVLSDHVTLEVECIDRMYLNLYVPRLQTPRGCAAFWIHHRGNRLASSALMGPMTERFVSRIESFCLSEGIDLLAFEKGRRKEDMAKAYQAELQLREGVLFVGKAQEKTRVVRTRRLRNPRTGATYPDLYRATAMVNHYYFYCVDDDFGPFFLKLGSYFPYTGKLCINGHEYVKRQLAKEGIDFEELDNGILRCDDPVRLQELCDGLDELAIERLARKWLDRLPHPFSREDQQAGYTHDISILQAEFSLTQVLDRPVSGRVFFEDVIRDNLDLGRPDHVQLVFERRVNRRTPGRFRTRVITDGVVPSLHIDYKNSRIKQYHKLGRALRTETTINDTRDFAIGKRLKNLRLLRKVGFQANRRLLSVQMTSHDTTIGEDVFDAVQKPVEVGTQRASGLRFGDTRAMALLSALVAYRLLPHGFRNRDLREHLAPLLGLDPASYGRGKMTYDLRRLRLHGLVERIPRSHRYRVTEAGFRTAAFMTVAHRRIVQAGLGVAHDPLTTTTAPVRVALAALTRAVDRACAARSVAA